MNIEFLQSILSDVADGKASVRDATDKLTNFSFEDIEYATIDHHRCLRKGFPEVIFGEGKTSAQITGIMEKMADQETVILVTRIDKQKATDVLQSFPGAIYHDDPRLLVWEKEPVKITGRGTVLVLAAGTSDIPVAMEAALTAKAMGNQVETIIDVGVAGIHRLFQHKKKIDAATVLIVVAGMEGALPSVVAGLVKAPVLAVPTSVGYGVSMKGMTALFAMLNSCSSNVAVVNIDNGFGAGYMASSINHT